MRTLLRRASAFLILGPVALACSTGSVADPLNGNAPNLTAKAGATLPQSKQTALAGACKLLSSDGTAALDGQQVKDAVDKAAGEGVGVGRYIDVPIETWLLADEKHTSKEALDFVQCLMNNDEELNGGCHPLAHSVGRATFTKEQTVDASFRACEETCHSGCYHGAMERFLGGGKAGDEVQHFTPQELAPKAQAACDVPTFDTTHKFQCLHGLGHALTYYLRRTPPGGAEIYDIFNALKMCEVTGNDWNAASCWGGVFMENIAAGEPQLRDLKTDDLSYPCDAVDDKYKDSCYIMQTSWMSQNGRSTEQLIKEDCPKAGTYKLTCDTSVGRDLSNGARTGNARAVSQGCEIGQQEELRACTRGVVYALCDNTWTGQWAFPYCKTYVSPDEQDYCFGTAVGYLNSVYGIDAAGLGQQCAQYAGNDAHCTSHLPH